MVRLMALKNRLSALYLIEVLVQAVHEEQQQLLRVLVLVAGEAVVDFTDGAFKILRADHFVLS